MPDTRPEPVPLAEVVRGPAVESRHVGAVAVILGDGRVWTAGPAEALVWARSAVKPIQALPLVERGVAERFELDDRELAIVCASHEGTARHVAVVDGLLAKAGLTHEHLRCGPHAPFDRDTALSIARGGGKPERVHNNCSGKHTGFLMVARDLGAPLDHYLDPDAPGQLLVREALADLAGIPADSIAVALDGCGAPTLGLPLLALATAFRRFVNPTGLTPVRAAACARIFAAISREPFHLAGDGRLETVLIESARGEVLPKCGAEGVYVVGVTTPSGPIGLAIKVADGAERGYQPAVVALLRSLGLWQDAVPPALARFAAIPVYNTQKRLAGEVRCTLDLPAQW